jgi:diacylglycerol O-acyltransferase
VALTRLRIDELAYTWLDDGHGAPLQLALLAIFDAGPFLGRDGCVALDDVRDALAQRASRVAAFSRRVVWTRPGEGRPVWAIDPAYDPRRHIAKITVPAGADLGSWAATRAARPLDRNRPLWRAEVIDGLDDGRFALLVIISHVLADGIAAVALASSLLDAAPTTRAVSRVAGTTGPLPSRRVLVRDHIRILGSLLRDTRHVRHAAPPAIDNRTTAREIRAAIAGFAGREPDTSLPRRFGDARQLAVVSYPLAEVSAIGHAQGATVNDVVLAVVAGGLRRWLTARGQNVTGMRLRCSVPATIDRPGRQVASMLLVPLPVGESDPRRRLALIRQATVAGKQQLRAASKDFTDLRLPLPVTRWFLRTSRRMGSRRLTLSITNVPGPTAPLWLAGAQMLTAVPIAPLAPLVPLSVAALSYAGQLTITINTDGAVNDLDVLADGVRASIADLGTASRLPRVEIAADL